MAREALGITTRRQAVGLVIQAQTAFPAWMQEPMERFRERPTQRPPESSPHQGGPPYPAQRDWPAIPVKVEVAAEVARPVEPAVAAAEAAEAQEVSRVKRQAAASGYSCTKPWSTSKG
jgi:hypothetical protein